MVAICVFLSTFAQYFHPNLTVMWSLFVSWSSIFVFPDTNRLNVRQSDRLNVSLFVQIADWYKMSIAYEPTYQLIRLMHFVSDCCKADLYPTHVETSGN